MTLQDIINWLRLLFTLPSTVPPAPEPVKPQEPQPEPVAPTPVPAPPAPHTSRLEAFIAEIQAMEGWYPGSTSYVNCNPGNLRCPEGQRSNWNVLAIDGGAKHKDFCVFHGDLAGMQALRNVTVSQCKGLSPHYNEEARKLGLHDSSYLTIEQYFVIRDPKSDGNDPVKLAQRFGKALGVNPSTFQLRELL